MCVCVMDKQNSVELCAYVSNAVYVLCAYVYANAVYVLRAC